MSQPLHEPKACKSCGAPVFWAQLPSGKSMPVDATPTPDGNVVLLHTAAGGIRARIVHRGEQPPIGAPLRKSHFQTCPNAAQHRKAKPKERRCGGVQDPDWNLKCSCCGNPPALPATGMCGACTFGEADAMWDGT